MKSLKDPNERLNSTSGEREPSVSRWPERSDIATSLSSGGTAVSKLGLAKRIDRCKQQRNSMFFCRENRNLPFL